MGYDTAGSGPTPLAVLTTHNLPLADQHALPACIGCGRHDQAAAAADAAVCRHLLGKSQLFLLPRAPNDLSPTATHELKPPFTTQAVDDIEDIGALERYVEESAVMCLFLSKGCTSAGIRTAVSCTRVCVAD
jgi:hypothetical protein